jgi:hypothetical protein
VSQGLVFGEWKTIEEYKRKPDAIGAMEREFERVGKRKALEQLSIFYRGKRIMTRP